MCDPWAFCCWSTAPLLELPCSSITLELPCLVVGPDGYRVVVSEQSKQAGGSGSKPWRILSWCLLCTWHAAGGLSSPNLGLLFRGALPSQWQTAYTFDILDGISFRQLWLVKTNMIYLHIIAFLAEVMLSHLWILSKSSSVSTSESELLLCKQ